MRIALVHYAFWPVIGGVETILREHAELFCSKGHDVTVFCRNGAIPPGFGSARDMSKPQWAPGADFDPGRASSGTFDVKPLPLSGGDSDSEATATTRAGFEVVQAQMVAALNPLLRKFDVVFLHNVCTMPFDLTLTAALWEICNTRCETRFVCWIHDLAAANPDYHFPSEIHPWDLLRQAHPRMEYVAVSELRRRQAQEVLGLPDSRCRVIPNGIDPCEQLQLPPSLRSLTHSSGPFERDIVLFHPARILRRKNIELSLRVTAALREKGQDVLLLLSGAIDPHNSNFTDHAAELSALHAELNLGEDAVFLKDRIEIGPAEMHSLYLLADALFFPSRQEGFGLPMLEAELHKTPAFCADIEPLNTLPGAIPFSLKSSPGEIASFLMRQISACPAIQGRKAVLRNFTWSAIWQNFLAPLLAEPTNSSHP